MIWGNTSNVKNINSSSCLIFLAAWNAESAAQCLQIYIHDRQLVVLLVSLICILQNLQQMYIHGIEWSWKTHNFPGLAEEAANLVRGYFRAAHFWNWAFKIESFSTRALNLGSEFIAASSSHWCIPGTGHSLFLWPQLQDTCSLKPLSNGISQITEPWALIKILGLVWKRFPITMLFHLLLFEIQEGASLFLFHCSSFWGCTRALNPCCLNPASKRVEFNYLFGTYEIAFFLFPDFETGKAGRHPQWDNTLKFYHESEDFPFWKQS